MDGDRNKIKSDKYNWLATQCLLFWLLYHLKMKVKKLKKSCLKAERKCQEISRRWNAFFLKDRISD